MLQYIQHGFFKILVAFALYILVVLLWKIARWRAFIAVFFMGYFFINLGFNTDDRARVVLEVYKQLNLRSEGISIGEFVQDYDAFNFVETYLFWIRVAASIIIPLLLLFIWEKFFQKKIGVFLVNKFSNTQIIGKLINFKIEFKIEDFFKWRLRIAAIFFAALIFYVIFTAVFPSQVGIIDITK